MTDTAATQPIRRYFELAPQPDADAYFAQFAGDATVEDEGTQHCGIEAIRAWRASVPLVTYTVHAFRPATAAPTLPLTSQVISPAARYASPSTLRSTPATASPNSPSAPDCHGEVRVRRHLPRRR